MNFESSKEVTFSSEITYINIPLLYEIAYTKIGEDGNVYAYDLLDLANNPSLFDFLKKL